MKTPEEMNEAITASFKEEAEKWIGKPIDPTTAAGRLVFWVAILRALDSGETIDALVGVGKETMVAMGEEPKWKM